MIEIVIKKTRLTESLNVLFQVLKPVLGFWLGRVSEPIFQAADRLLQVLKKILSSYIA